MIITNNGSGSFTVTEPSTTIATYNLTTKVYLNNIQVATVIPHTFSPTIGVHEIKIEMANVSSTFTDKYCLLYDDNLYCDIVTKLGTMSETDRVKSNLPYMYYVLAQGTTSTSCVCQCDNVKTFYTELKDTITAPIC